MEQTNWETTVTKKEMEVIRIMRECDYGKVVVTVKEGMPVHVEVSKSILIK